MVNPPRNSASPTTAGTAGTGLGMIPPANAPASNMFGGPASNMWMFGGGPAPAAPPRHPGLFGAQSFGAGARPAPAAGGFAFGGFGGGGHPLHGELVLANSRNLGVFHMGKVVKVHDHGGTHTASAPLAFDVHYLAHHGGNGAAVETQIPATHIVLPTQARLAMNVTPGTAVLCNSQNQNQWHAGTIDSVDTNAFGYTTFTIRYASHTVGGDPTESGVPVTHVVANRNLAGAGTQALAPTPPKPAATFAFNGCQPAAAAATTATGMTPSAPSAPAKSAAAATSSGTGAPTRSHIAMLIDRSGSMQSMGTEVSAGINHYLDEQRQFSFESGAITNITLATFDHSYALVHDKNLAVMPHVTDADVAPRGQTALYDAIARLLADTEHKIGRGGEFDKVIIFILTDGHENASRVVRDTATIQRMIAKYKAAPYGWEFFFAGANQDAVLTGAHLGLGRDDCVTFGSTPDKMRAAFGATSAQTRSAQRGMSKAFTPQQRATCN